MTNFVVQGDILHVSYRAGGVQIIWDTDHIICNHTEIYMIFKKIHMSSKSTVKYNNTQGNLITCNAVFIELSSSNRVAYYKTL